MLQLTCLKGDLYDELVFQRADYRSGAIRTSPLFEPREAHLNESRGRKIKEDVYQHPSSAKASHQLETHSLYIDQLINLA